MKATTIFGASERQTLFISEVSSFKEFWGALVCPSYQVILVCMANIIGKSKGEKDRKPPVFDL